MHTHKNKNLVDRVHHNQTSEVGKYQAVQTTVTMIKSSLPK